MSLLCRWGTSASETWGISQGHMAIIGGARIGFHDQSLSDTSEYWFHWVNQAVSQVLQFMRQSLTALGYTPSNRACGAEAIPGPSLVNARRVLLSALFPPGVWGFPFTILQCGDGCLHRNKSALRWVLWAELGIAQKLSVDNLSSRMLGY